MRTAVLVGASLCVFSIIAWQVIIWTAMGPAAQAAVSELSQRAEVAVAARRSGSANLGDARFEDGGVPPPQRFLRGFAFFSYVEMVRAGLKSALDSPDVQITRIAAPSEVWVKLRGTNTWLVMSWRLVGPKAPIAAAIVLSAAAVIVMLAAALSAHRLNRPLARLALAAANVADGNKIDIGFIHGPAEVKALAVAFENMAERLAAVDEQRELMLGGISHDLRTPLARLRVAVELLEQEDPALLDEMTASVEEMDRMIGQFLYYVRANYSESPALAVLDDVVRAALAMYASDTGIHIRCNGPAARRFAVECLRHSLLNLVQNALEYGRTPILVTASVEAAEVIVAVRDSGTGLSAVQWHDAIRPFHRLRPQPSQGHSGLGLALVDRLVAKAQGTLIAQQIESGFLVTIRLPAA